jgi:site-specific recombinase XerC
MKVLSALALTATLTAGAAYADCQYPPAPDKLPDGATATLEQMLTAQKTVKAYQKSIDDYVACIDKALEEAMARSGDKLKPEQKLDMQKVEAQKHNAAIDQEQSIADRFNEQVKVFKARTAEKKN